jgi:preprotein translocase subunit SecD
MPVTSQRSNKVPTRSQVKSRLAGIAVLLVFCAVVAAPHITNKGIDWVNAKANLGLPRLPDKGYNLGLDLQGGAHLVYQAKTDAIPEADKADSVEGVRDVIERRVRGGLGVAEPLVQTTKVGSDYRIIVELPGVTDVNEAIKSIGETPVLEFKEQNNEPPRDLTAAETKELNDFNKAAAAKAKTAVQAVQRGQNFAEAAAKY